MYVTSMCGFVKQVVEYNLVSEGVLAAPGGCEEGRFLSRGREERF